MVRSPPVFTYDLSCGHPHQAHRPSTHHQSPESQPKGEAPRYGCFHATVLLQYLPHDRAIISLATRRWSATVRSCDREHY